MKRHRSAFAFYRSMSRSPVTVPFTIVPVFECPGCHWTLKDAAQIAEHKEKCADHWLALAEQMKRAAMEANAQGKADDYEAFMRRSEACAKKAQLARKGGA